MSDDEGWAQRAKRGGYLLVVSIVTTFVVGLFAVMMIEVLGPSETAAGRVIERIEGSRDVTRCTGTGSCRTTTYPTFSVVGERMDGTTWIAVGEGPYDAMRGERGVIDVETSRVTGRVVGLVGNDSFDSEWSVSGSGFVWFSIGAMAIWMPLLVAYEWRRRTGFFALGAFVPSDAAFAVLGLVVGLVGLWFVSFSKTAGLDVASSQDLYGDFLVDPLAFVADDDAENPPGIQVGEFFEPGRDTRLAMVGLDDLGAVPSLPSDVMAIALLRTPQHTRSPLDRIEFSIEGPAGAEFEPIDCPSGVLGFPSQLGVDRDIDGGFVCFPSEADGGELRLVVGSGVFADSLTPEYESVR